MRKNFVLLIVGVIGLAVLLYFVSPLSHTEEKSSRVIEAEDDVDPAPVEEPKPEVAQMTEKPSAPAAAQATNTQPKGPSPAVQKIFSQKLRELGSCLETQNSVPGDELEPSLTTVIDSVRGDWGASSINPQYWLLV